MSHYIHHIPGRLRVKTPALKYNEVEAARASDLLTGFKGVHGHKVKAMTGSITVHYDVARTEPHAILGFLKEHGFIGGGTPALPKPALRASAVLIPAAASTPRPKAGRLPDVVSEAGKAFGASAGKVFGKMLFEFAVEKLLERSAVALIRAVL